MRIKSWVRDIESIASDKQRLEGRKQGVSHVTMEERNETDGGIQDSSNSRICKFGVSVANEAAKGVGWRWERNESQVCVRQVWGPAGFEGQE